MLVKKIICMGWGLALVVTLALAASAPLAQAAPLPSSARVAVTGGASAASLASTWLTAASAAEETPCTALNGHMWWGGYYWAFHYLSRYGVGRSYGRRVEWYVYLGGRWHDVGASSWDCPRR